MKILFKYGDTWEYYVRLFPEIMADAPNALGIHNRNPPKVLPPPTAISGPTHGGAQGAAAPAAGPSVARGELSSTLAAINLCHNLSVSEWKSRYIKKCNCTQPLN